MVRDEEARGGGPLRRGNPMPPEAPEVAAPVPTAADDAMQNPNTPRPSAPAADAARSDATVDWSAPPSPPSASTGMTSKPPAPGTRAAAAAAASAAAAPATITTPARPTSPAPGIPAPGMPATAGPAEPRTPPLPPSTARREPQAAPIPPAPAATRPADPASAARISAAPASSEPGSTPAAPQQAPAIPPAPSPAAPPAAATPAWPAAAPSDPGAAAPPVPTDTAPPTRPVAAPTAPTAPTAHAAPTIPSQSAASSRRLQREQGTERRSFLQQERREEPARRGGRGVLNRVGFSLGPNARERAVRDDEHAVSRHWPGPRTVAVVNGKGGAGKTPATVLLSAVFAQYGGAGVLAWDNNQTRGTLGWRTETGAHDRTLLELLPQTQRLLGAQGQSADLAHFVHHQPQEKYDVLRSKPIRLAHENRLSPADVDSIHAVAAKFYRLIIIDSGNDESDPMWLRMIDLADQIVVATTTRDDHAEAGALLLEALEDRDERSARLARESVVVVSQADPKASSAEVAEVVAGYEPLAREVVGIPFDREMVDGHLRLRALAAPTRQAWLSAAAAVARGF